MVHYSEVYNSIILRWKINHKWLNEQENIFTLRMAKTNCHSRTDFVSS